MKIYVSGKYSSDNIIDGLKNIREGIKVAALLIKMGHIPFCPFLDHQFFFYEDITIEEIQNYSLSWLENCEAIYVMSGYENSKGTLKEIEVAKQKGIKIYYYLKDIK